MKTQISADHTDSRRRFLAPQYWRLHYAEPEARVHAENLTAAVSRLAM